MSQPVYFDGNSFDSTGEYIAIYFACFRLLLDESLVPRI